MRTPKDDHQDLMLMMGRRLAHEEWRVRSAALRSRYNQAHAHLATYIQEADDILIGWPDIDKLRRTARRVIELIHDIGLIAAGGHREHAERGTLRPNHIPPRENPVEGNDTPMLPVLAAKWRSADLETDRQVP